MSGKATYLTEPLLAMKRAQAIGTDIVLRVAKRAELKHQAEDVPVNSRKMVHSGVDCSTYTSYSTALHLTMCECFSCWWSKASISAAWVSPWSAYNQPQSARFGEPKACLGSTGQGLSRAYCGGHELDSNAVADLFAVARDNLGQPHVSKVPLPQALIEQNV